MKKIKILHFELDEHLGGIETFLYNLYSTIDREQVEFEFVTSSLRPALGEKLEKLGGKIRYVNSYKKLFSYISDINILLKNEYDVVHIHKNSAANILPVILCKINKVPIIFVHSHNTKPSVGKMMLLHKINRNFLTRNVARRFACSTEAGNWLYGNNHFQLMSNGIMAQRFLYNEEERIRKRCELSIKENEIVFGHIGRFTEQKNHKLLIEIYSEIKKLCPKSKLILVGDGELKNNIEAKVQELDLTENVIFLGVRNDIPELLMCMDAFVMPSLYEGLPIVAIEAQATGLPMYVSDTVSSETEITNCLHWFSIQKKPFLIAKQILNGFEVKQSNERIKQNKIIVDKGYDIRNTSEKMLNFYIDAIKR